MHAREARLVLAASSRSKTTSRAPGLFFDVIPALVGEHARGSLIGPAPGSARSARSSRCSAVNFLPHWTTCRAEHTSARRITVHCLKTKSRCYWATLTVTVDTDQLNAARATWTPWHDDGGRSSGSHQSSIRLFMLMVVQPPASALRHGVPTTRERPPSWLAPSLSSLSPSVGLASLFGNPIGFQESILHRLRFTQIPFGRAPSPWRPPLPSHPR